MLYAPSSSLFVTWRTSQSDSLPWLLRMGSDHQSEGIWISAWRSCALLCLSALFVSLFGKCERFLRKAQNQLDVSLFFFSSVYRTIELVDGWNGKVIHTQVYFSKSSIFCLKICYLKLNNTLQMSWMVRWLCWRCISWTSFTLEVF